MFELRGKYNSCKVFTDLIEDSAVSQLTLLMNQEFCKDSKIRIMSDVHSGAGCTIGTTMTIHDKIVPNLVGVDLNCIDKDTEVLTPNGWIKIADYNNQQILIYDKIKDKAFFEKPYAYIKAPCDEFYHFYTSKGLDQMLSANHKMLLWCGYKSKGYVQKIQLAEDTVRELSRLKKADYYNIKTTFDFEQSNMNISDDIIRIIIMISADGRVRYTKKLNHTHVELHFRKIRKIQRAQMLLQQANIPFTTSMRKDKSIAICFTLPGKISKDLSQFYKLSKEQLKIVIDEIYHWDGTIDEKRNHKCFSSTIKSNVDFIQFALHATGTRCGISEIKSKLINHNTTYMTYETQNQYVGLKKHVDKKPSLDGYKYCFTTSTGFFVIRRNNCISITGNCGMLCIQIQETAFDPAKLDNIIRQYVPSGHDIHETEDRTYTTAIDNLIAPVNTSLAYRSIGSLGGGELIATGTAKSVRS